MKHFLLFIIWLPLIGQPALAQKKALQQKDCKQWRVIQDANISSDGRWVSYKYSHLYDQSDTLPDTYLYDSKQQKTIILKNVSEFSFFNSGEWIKIVQKTPTDTMGTTADSTFLIRLSNQKRIHWDKNTFLYTDNSPWVIYTEPIHKNGLFYNNLTKWNVNTGKSETIERVGMYYFFDNRQSLVYEHKGENRSSLRLRHANGKEETIFQCPAGRLGSFSFDEPAQGGTFLVAADSTEDNNPSLLYSFTINPVSCRLLVNLDEIKGIPRETKIARRPYSLINEGNDIMIELDPASFTPTPPKQKSDLGFELELWTWNEPLSHRRQRPSHSGFNPMDYPKYIYHIDTKELVELSKGGADSYVIPSNADYNYIFAQDSKPYLTAFDWQHDLCSDYYLINLKDGSQTKVLTNVRQAPQWSPNGKHAIWYDREKQAWFNIDLPSGKLKNISSSIPYPVHDELHDMPKPAPSYDIAGWLNDGNSVAIYDRYDIWVVDLTGKQATYSLTQEYGRKHHTQLRFAGNDLQTGGFVKGFDTRTKATGIYNMDKKGNITRLLKGDYNFQIIKVADNAKYCIWSKNSFEVFEDIWWSDSRFSHPQRVTNANPQQQNYFWGTTRLVRWTTFDGIENEGILFLPENYDSTRCYPVIVTFYERHTDGLFDYRIPELSSSVIDVPTYVSNDYIVFMPDVHYKIGDPAESCYDNVVSGVQMLIDKGIADKERIGLIGHSWGGYEVAYLVTRTDIFRCASPGAAVVNTISSYTALRGGGMPRLYVYEDAQGRLGKSLWEDPDMYIRNSPIFNADKIHTPLLIFHCDEDNAVPFSQGLDLFFAMRRLERPAWLLNYKGEGHSLNGEAAMLDWGIRLKQFFDHYLKDSPMPRWMREGISIDEQGYDLKYE